MGVVRSVFLNEQQARAALRLLRSTFGDHRVTMRLFTSYPDYPGNKEDHGNPEEYEPVGALQLASTPVTTLPAAGGTLVGNSTTLPLSIGEFGDIVALVADAEERHQDRRETNRIVATVEVHSSEEAAVARSLMRDCGGHDISPG